MRPLHRLFKKFKSIDFNDYFYAVINEEFYFAVGTNYFYADKILGFKIPRVEEEFFSSVKVPATIMAYMLKLAKCTHDADLTKMHDELKTEVIGAMVEGIEQAVKMNPEKETEIRATYGKQFNALQNRFYQDWVNPLIGKYLKDSWTFLCTEYAGKATRDIWLCRHYDGITNLIRVKLFGSERDNEVVDVKRILLDVETMREFIQLTTGQTVQETEHPND